MNEGGRPDALTWRQLPVERRREVTLILGRMAHRRLPEAVSATDPNDDQGSVRLLASDKVHGRHRERLAVVYVRQSTVQQVERHQESTRLQYGLVEQALALGWARAGVGLGHIGLVLGIEMSRLARSCRDWHQLLEICALCDTLIADADGIYDPASHNDRLLLGLKGTMSEAELHILKARMHEGRLAKARRGELQGHSVLPWSTKLSA
jgi:hypothetical protein